MDSSRGWSGQWIPWLSWCVLALVGQEICLNHQLDPSDFFPFPPKWCPFSPHSPAVEQLLPLFVWHWPEPSSYFPSPERALPCSGLWPPAFSFVRSISPGWDLSTRANSADTSWRTNPSLGMKSPWSLFVWLLGFTRVYVWLLSHGKAPEAAESKKPRVFIKI